METGTPTLRWSEQQSQLICLPTAAPPSSIRHTTEGTFEKHVKKEMAIVLQMSKMPDSKIKRPKRDKTNDDCFT